MPKINLSEKTKFLFKLNAQESMFHKDICMRFYNTKNIALLKLSKYKRICQCFLLIHLKKENHLVLKCDLPHQYNICVINFINTMLILVNLTHKI